MSYSLKPYIELCEQNERPLDISVQETMPATFAFPELANNDPYRQYRYGIALAAAAAHEYKDFAQKTSIGSCLVTIARSNEEERIIQLAARLMGVKSHLISTKTSEEPKDTNAKSIV